MSSSALTAFATVLKRDLRLAFRQRSEIANPLVFFVVVVALFPVAVGPEPELLADLAPGILWVAGLLASVIALDTVFKSDFEDGSLEQLLLSCQPTLALVIAKITAHWMVTGLPLLIAALAIGTVVYLPAEAIVPLLITMLLGTPTLSLIGAMIVALTVGLRGSGLLLALLVLPLYIPILIFSVSAVRHGLEGAPIGGELYVLGALLALAITLAPLTTVFCLRSRYY
jgi:heme exporter protein B